MRESELMGFDERYFNVYRLRGLAKLLEADHSVVSSWLSKYVSTSNRWKTLVGMASTFYCGAFEFSAADRIIYDPRRVGFITNRWHIYHV